MLNVGSILTDQFVLTAYHCIADKIPQMEYMQAFFGISTKQEGLYLESYDHEIHHSSIREASLFLIGLRLTSYGPYHLIHIK